jgi:nucleotide-binding universal stress UspA family protein
MFQRIVIATDGSATALRAEERGMRLAGRLGATVTFVCAGSPERSTAVAEAARERWALDAQEHGVALDVHVGSGDAASVILDAAESLGADLIVVGNKGMQGARRLLNSVPNKVGHHAHCAVLVVKTT